MSGEAGASHQSRLYSIFLGTGMTVSVAAPPGEDPTPHIAAYFESESAPYEQKLAAVASDLDLLFERILRDQSVPITLMSEPSEQIFGVVIEDLRVFSGPPAVQSC